MRLIWGAAIITAAMIILLCAHRAAAMPILTVPEGFKVVYSEQGRLPNGTCPYGCQPANYYDPYSRVAVLATSQTERTLWHETCHAHQHQTILSETGKEPSRDLRQWYSTVEGQAYKAAAVGWGPIPDWAMSADNLLEDFANACAYYIMGVPLDEARQVMMRRLLGE